jgi:DNA-binding FrmR family transcriptional regulator
MAHKAGPLGDDVAKRLARLAGHAASLKKMWEDERDADELLTQISAVRAALDQVGKLIFAHEIENLVAEAAESGKSKDAIKELKSSLDRLV